MQVHSDEGGIPAHRDRRVWCIVTDFWYFRNGCSRGAPYSLWYPMLQSNRIDSSARNQLICNVTNRGLADFEAFSEGDAGENNGWERVDSGQKSVNRLTGEVRKFSHEPPQTPGNWRKWQEKTPTGNGWGFIIGGGVATGFKPRL